MASEDNESKNASNGNKIMDVAKPGTSDPETGSKPMVVGHKSMASDPSITTHKDDSAEGDTTEPDVEAKITLSPSKKLTLQPLSKETEEKQSAEAAPDDKNTASNEPASTESISATSISTESELPDEPSKKSPENIEKERIETLDKREQSLQTFIKSGEYHVHIKESSGSNAKTYLVTFIVVGLFGVILLAVLADLDLIQLGFDLPFNLL